MAFLRKSRFSRTSVRHRSQWEVGPRTSSNGGSQIISGSVAQIGALTAVAQVDGITLIRTRGELLMYLTSAVASLDGFFGAFGIGKATAAALLVGVTAVPTPITEESWDGWLYHRFFSLMAPGPIAVATAAQEQLQVAPAVSALRFEVDSKAMRKIDVDESFYCAIEVVEVGASSMSWHMNSRMLVKLMS